MVVSVSHVMCSQTCPAFTSSLASWDSLQNSSVSQEERAERRKKKIPKKTCAHHREILNLIAIILNIIIVVEVVGSLYYYYYFFYYDNEIKWLFLCSLLFTKVKLEEALFGPAAALQTCEEMLQEWQSRYDVSRSKWVENTRATVITVVLKKQAFPVLKTRMWK